ncbi:nucleoside diphosphate kinase, mitochondrial [Hemitrygon akajei]|uniref:nucleoside diphosphate kinase, mitochondrial n=1 Tax=Hemitrygon akajei TaxID=2704970 RepID=UPI003BFA28C3
MLLRALSRLWTERRLPASPGLRWAAAGLRLLSSGAEGFCEQTLVAVKPDGVQRRLVGEIIQRFERRGFQLVGLKLVQAPQDILSAHYHDLAEKPFYPALIEYMSSGPIIAMVWEGHDVVKVSRMMVGATSPGEALPGTIRGDLCVHISRNAVHASDSVEVAKKEIGLWFRHSELVQWECCAAGSTYNL